jgi:hypothetical protein
MLVLFLLALGAATLIWRFFGWCQYYCQSLEYYQKNLDFDKLKTQKVIYTLDKWVTFLQYYGIVNSVVVLISMFVIGNFAPKIDSITIALTAIAYYPAFLGLRRVMSGINYYFAEKTPKIWEISERKSILQTLEWSLGWIQFLTLLNLIVNLVYKYSPLANLIVLVISMVYGIFYIVLLQMFKILIKSVLERIEQNTNSSAALPLG